MVDPDIVISSNVLDSQIIRCVPSYVTYYGIAVLLYLLKNKDSYIWKICKELRVNPQNPEYNSRKAKKNKKIKKYIENKFVRPHSATIRKIIREQLQSSSATIFVEVNQDEDTTKRAKKVIKYRLTKKGYLLLSNLYCFGSFTKETKKKKLKEIFYTVQKNYPSFLPKIFNALPPEYCVAFYPQLEQNLIQDFQNILKYKSKNPAKELVTIGKQNIIASVSLTSKEEEIILNYVTSNKTKLID